MTDPILVAKEVVKSFGGIRAVDGCSLQVFPSTITALIGPNGAGKTTFLNIVAGLYGADSGEIWFDRVRIDGLPAHAVVRGGLIKTFQIPRELRNFTVLQNLMVAAPPGPGDRFIDLFVRPFAIRRAEEEVVEAAEAVLAQVGLTAMRDEYAKNLSGGQKKLLELARALMARPRLVLLDEPVAGVNLTLQKQILQVMEGLRARGTTFFLVEHDMDVVMKNSDWIIVMHQGRTLAEGRADEVKANPAVIDSYLGG
ncbi:MAG TPA: ABC transporter ATP-binding protein [Thermoplasmata archaeon]|nr:ABC transporter ATP-binding protein [Thermoplasmata archaeon]